MPRTLPAALILVVAVLSATGLPFKLLPTRWPEPRVVFSNGALPEPFASALDEAAREWTDRSGFEFEISGSNPACDNAGNLLNGADFFPRSCDGARLGPTTLAVTETISVENETVATGITFNSELNWAVYDTQLRPGEPDFRRVALHELGHVGGLGHEDATPSIMSSRIDETISLQPDDLAGIQALYPELEGFEPEIPDEVQPAATDCSGDAKAAGGFCKAVFACLSSNARNPDLGTRVACTAGAEANFVAANGCAGAANMVTSRVFSIDEDIVLGVDSSDTDHRKLHSKVLGHGGKQCSKALSAEAKNSRKPNASKLAAKRTKARAAFVRKGSRTIAKGEKRGNPYEGPSASALANRIDALVDETVDFVIQNP